MPSDQERAQEIADGLTGPALTKMRHGIPVSGPTMRKLERLGLYERVVRSGASLDGLDPLRTLVGAMRPRPRRATWRRTDLGRKVASILEADHE